MTEVLVVGRIERPHGLSGEVSVGVRTDFPERFRPGVLLLWRREQEERTLILQTARPHGKRLLLAFEGVEGVDAARALSGGDLCVTAAEAYPAPEGFFFAHEIEGWACKDPSGRALGRAAGLEKSPGGALLSVEVSPGRIALVPFVHPIVVRVDRENRTIVLDPPAGLMEL